MLVVHETELIFKLKRNGMVIEDVPGLACPQCPETSIDSAVARLAYQMADSEIKKKCCIRNT